MLLPQLSAPACVLPGLCQTVTPEGSCSSSHRTHCPAGGWEAAAPFAAGGVAGLLYQLLIQRSVDAIPGGAGAYPPVRLLNYPAAPLPVLVY